MLGVQDQRYMHYPLVQLVRLFAAQHVQEVGTDGIVIGIFINAHTIVAESVPVADDRREYGQHAVGSILLLGEIGLRFQIAEHGAAGTHHIHRVSVFRNTLKHFFQRLRQAAQLFQFGLVRSQLGTGWQMAFQDQVGNFLELAGCRQILHIIAAVGQTRT